MTFTSLRFRGATGIGTYLYDEVRIGTSVADVVPVPEPQVLALLAIAGLVTVGTPSGSQAIQSFGVALLSGVIATLLFFRATDLVRHSQRQLAVVESTQSFEVLFTLIGGVLLLHDSVPDVYGWVGVGLIVVGMVLSSLASLEKPVATN